MKVGQRRRCRCSEILLTDTLQLLRHEQHDGLRVLAILRVLLDDRLQVFKPVLERLQHGIGVCPRLVHHREDLLTEVSALRWERLRLNLAALTLMDAI
jgi:hypothetical protein